MEANIVLGLGYGDEGKGITTDFLCSQYPDDSINIRFSGGQQAGHTVMVGNDKHTFKSFGAGTFRNVPSYFSEHTTFYPNSIQRELNILSKYNCEPELILHPLSKLTTPFDVFANRQDKANHNHGTCGIGIGKTIKRNEGTYKLHAVDLLDTTVLYEKLKHIAIHYNLDMTDELKKEVEDFKFAIHNLKWTIANYEYLLSFDNLIFEGSQGILLDMTHGVFPHVTYSNTTSKNAHEILDKLGVVDRNIYYITRSYSTRHGNGHFIEEDIELINNEHEINVNNAWQGAFKVASLDYNKINYALSVDGIYSNNVNGMIQKNLVVTCLDQYPMFDISLIRQEFENVFHSYSPDNANFKKSK